ncbi:hypothetical protein M2323_004028 [Rhodoblastus acidophilus]|uniref:hypothetical protein n=1 Tax=Rhodoblastus acidophilus TaxID=1074 RepID=UPI002225A026|nr:hypothetical protein [Rhodoblastus acidophilus]MCW2286233.1 hypothetical protein [Rhodoblastus acidophilus]MCW2335084.1 hypothetical protein [Rhodoblastus acidophilus]
MVCATFLWGKMFSLGRFLPAIAVLFGSAMAADNEVLFAKKAFLDVGDAVSVIGTISGDGVGYPNNSARISCYRARNECVVTTVEQIGLNHVGSISEPAFIPVARWTATEIVAEYDGLGVGCSSLSIFIDRGTHRVRWVQAPKNSAYALCEHSEHTTLNWYIDDAPGQKQFDAK